LVKDDTWHETDGARDEVQTSAALVKVTFFKTKVAVKEVDTEATNCTVTAPTAGRLTKAAIVSKDVAMLKPVLVPSVVKAAAALRVKSVHVTVTAPAARVAVFARVSVITFVPYSEVAVVAGEVMVHLSAAA